MKMCFQPGLTLTLSHSSHALPAPKPSPVHTGHDLLLNSRTENMTPKDAPSVLLIRSVLRQWSHFAMKYVSTCPHPCSEYRDHRAVVCRTQCSPSRSAVLHSVACLDARLVVRLKSLVILSRPLCMRLAALYFRNCGQAACAGAESATGTTLRIRRRASQLLVNRNKLASRDRPSRGTDHIEKSES